MKTNQQTMFQELDQDQFERVRSLFQPFDYSLSIKAALEGNNPGRIFVDDPSDPRTALALTVEGYLLAGKDSNPETNRALSALLAEKIFSGQIAVNGDWSMSLAVHPENWESRLPAIIPTHDIETIERYHYLCTAVKHDWRANLPGGYAIRRVDQALLNQVGVSFPDPVREWMDIEEMWWTEEHFLEKGISFAAVFAGAVVGWCTPDCAAGDQIDVGIFIQPDHRRKNLAAALVAATVECCLDSGFQRVGWHCNAANTASWKTAEKVGFKRNRVYKYYYYMYDPIDHLAELGWYHYQQGEYARTVAYYQRVFSERDENPDYYYHLAASAWAFLGNKDKALFFLRAAAEHGWQNAAFTRQRVEFEFLQDLPEWEAVLAQMDPGHSRED